MRYDIGYGIYVRSKADGRASLIYRARQWRNKVVWIHEFSRNKTYISNEEDNSARHYRRTFIYD